MSKWKEPGEGETIYRELFGETVIEREARKARERLTPPSMVTELPPDAQKAIDETEVLRSESLVAIATLEVRLEAERARLRLLEDLIESVRAIYL